ncbi:MAG TPA: DUF192 domain-containing protein [Clostridium sp.]|uniref:DUF192 domain-containing protein n=1 Tax=Clostridium sp. TaxID=1506 RepID=UPI002F920BA5
MIKVLKYNNENTIKTFIADSYTKRLCGYMFRKQPHHDAILLKPCNGIHTFFMKFNIDVLFLNEHMQVIIKIENLKPGQVVTKVKGAKLVLEAKEGTFYNIKEGSKLDIC